MHHTLGHIRLDIYWHLFLKSAIFLIRSPFDSIVSLFLLNENLSDDWKVNLTDPFSGISSKLCKQPSQLNTSKWEAFVVKQIVRWKEMVKYWTSLPSSYKVLIIRYEVRCSWCFFICIFFFLEVMIILLRIWNWTHGKSYPRCSTIWTSPLVKSGSLVRWNWHVAHPRHVFEHVSNRKRITQQRTWNGLGRRQGKLVCMKNLFLLLSISVLALICGGTFWRRLNPYSGDMDIRA